MSLSVNYFNFLRRNESMNTSGARRTVLTALKNVIQTPCDSSMSYSSSAFSFETWKLSGKTNTSHRKIPRLFHSVRPINMGQKSNTWGCCAVTSRRSDDRNTRIMRSFITADKPARHGMKRRDSHRRDAIDERGPSGYLGLLTEYANHVYAKLPLHRGEVTRLRGRERENKLAYFKPTVCRVMFLSNALIYTSTSDKSSTTAHYGVIFERLVQPFYACPSVWLAFSLVKMMK